MGTAEMKLQLENEQIEIEKQVGLKMSMIRKLDDEIKELNTLHLKNQGKLEMLEELKDDGSSETE